MAEMCVTFILPDDKDYDNLKKVATNLAATPDEALLIVNQARDMRIELPLPLIRLLADAASQLAAGHTVGITHYERDITTREAAEILQVSRPYVVKILEKGEIPYYMVGSHRRIRLNDVLDYKKRRDNHRREKLDELYRISEEAGLYEIDSFPTGD